MNEFHALEIDTYLFSRVVVSFLTYSDLFLEYLWDKYCYGQPDNMSFYNWLKLNDCKP